MLYNPRLQRVYDVRDDIPVMLIDEARAVDDAEATRLQGRIDAEGIAATFPTVAPRGRTRLRSGAIVRSDDVGEPSVAIARPVQPAIASLAATG